MGTCFFVREANSRNGKYSPVTFHVTVMLVGFLDRNIACLNVHFGLIRLIDQADRTDSDREDLA